MKIFTPRQLLLVLFVLAGCTPEINEEDSSKFASFDQLMDDVSDDSTTHNLPNGVDTDSELNENVVVSSGERFDCTPIRVWDGDGPIWCQEGPKVRLAGIAAREIDESCKPNHPCPEVSGVVARNTLAQLIGTVTGQTSEGHLLVSGPTLNCTSVGGALGNRTGAWCESPLNGDLSCAMVALKAAQEWPKFWKNHKCPK